MTRLDSRPSSDNEATWCDLMQPWGEKYMALVEEIREHCAGLDDESLNALGSATHGPTNTNVWWATYRVTLIVQQVIREEQYERHLRSNRAGGDRDE